MVALSLGVVNGPAAAGSEDGPRTAPQFSDFDARYPSIRLSSPGPTEDPMAGIPVPGIPLRAMVSKAGPSRVKESRRSGKRLAETPPAP